MKPTLLRSGVALAVLVGLSGLGLPAADPPKPDSLDPDLLRKAAAAKSTAERSAALVTALETFVQLRARAAKTAVEAAAAAETEAAGLNAAKAAAEKVLAQTSKDDREAREAAEKLVAATTAAAKVAAARAATARRTAEMARAARDAAEKQLLSRVGPLRVAFNEAAAAEAAALGGLKPLDAGAWDYAKARHLLCRAGFGGTPDEVARLHALGLHLAVAYLVDYQKQPLPNLPFEVALPDRPLPDEPFLGRQEQAFLANRRRTTDSLQMQRLRQWWFQRMIQSPRPLQEKLTLLWHGHFATEQRIVQSSYAVYRQNELFREHAAGNFGALLHGIAHDPAMLRYLDNNTNVKGKPNENLAREILELFSMGEGQGYTEKDIMEGARALTGCTFDPSSGQFRFRIAQHDPGLKTIFGQTGNWNAEDFVELILQQPATSRFIAGKLFTWFAYEKPAPEVVERLASVLRHCNYEIAPTLRNLFLSEEFYSPRAMGKQIKSPVQLLVGMYRELGPSGFGNQALESYARALGQDLFDPPNVKGWEGGRQWINANVLITRYNLLTNLVELRTFIPGQPFIPNQPQPLLDIVSLLQGKEFSTPAEVVDYLVKCHLAVPIAPAKRQELLAYLGDRGDFPPSAQWANRRDEVNRKLRGLLVLLFASPEYQMT